VLKVPKLQRTPEQQTLAKQSDAQINLVWDEVVNALSPADREKRARLRRQALLLRQPVEA